MQPDQTSAIIKAIQELNSSLAVKDIISIVAIFLSPVIAVLVTLFWGKRTAAINEKRKVFSILMANRHNVAIEAQAQAFNMIDVVFYRDKKIRQLWHELFDLYNNEGLDNPLGWEVRKKKLIELLTEMAKVLNYGTITHLDVDRIYNPKGLFESKNIGNLISFELLRVLKSTGGLQVTPKQENTSGAK
ncbi:MAG: hypothetical protein HY892_02270 [Deltaproteobacteria bacterium]|nr:hypothetical protein [Deltaproteobacteria bacterium]